MDPEILERNGRVNPPVKECLKLLDAILSAGFLEVNVDLMAGIPGRNSTNLERDFATLADAGCNLITIYIDKRTYRDPHKEKERCSLLQEMGQLARRFPDYTVNGGQDLNEYNTFIRDKGYNLSFRRRFTTDLNRPNVYCLGLGEFARSCADKYIFHYQQEPSPYL